MNGVLSAGSERPETFMEGNLNRTKSTTEALMGATVKLNELLLKLRGNVPQPEDPGNKQKEPTTMTEHYGYHQQAHTELLNKLHDQIDELAKII